MGHVMQANDSVWNVMEVLRGAVPLLLLENVVEGSASDRTPRHRHAAADESFGGLNELARGVNALTHSLNRGGLERIQPTMSKTADVVNALRSAGGSAHGLARNKSTQNGVAFEGVEAVDAQRSVQRSAIGQESEQRAAFLAGEFSGKTGGKKRGGLCSARGQIAVASTTESQVTKKIKTTSGGTANLQDSDAPLRNARVRSLDNGATLGAESSRINAESRGAERSESKAQRIEATAVPSTCKESFTLGGATSTTKSADSNQMRLGSRTGSLPLQSEPRLPVSRFLPSEHCHVCTRQRSDVLEAAACGGVQDGTCRKVICIKCFRRYGWDWEAALLEKSRWRCSHCRNVCPDQSQCHAYRKTNERRKQAFMPGSAVGNRSSVQPKRDLSQATRTM